MDNLASSVFRRSFAKLDAPTVVTVNGHAIGTWLPGVPVPQKATDAAWAKLTQADEVEQYDAQHRSALRSAPQWTRPPMRETVGTIEEHELTPQQRRDAILRKINSRPK